MKGKTKLSVLLILCFAGDQALGTEPSNNLSINIARSALENHYKEFRNCVSLNVFEISIKNFSIRDNNGNQTLINIMNSLVENNLYSVKNIKRQGLESLLNPNSKEVAELEYKMTEFGYKYYGSFIENGMSNRGLCFGERKIIEVLDFTEPTSFMGNIISEVQYSYKIVNLPQWAETEAFSKYVQQVTRVGKDAIPRGKHILVKYESGWKIGNEHTLRQN